MNKCTIIFSDGCIDPSAIHGLPTGNFDIDFTFIPQKGFAPSDIIMITIAFELLKNLAYSGCYDLMKYTVLSVLKKVKSPKKQNMTLTIIQNGKKSKIDFPFELSEDQKDKVVDAAIQKLLD